MINPQTILGLQVMHSDMCVTREPVRVLKRKRWMSAQYHRRVQKKWTKRFGVCEKPTTYTMGGVLMCHPSIYAKLKEQFSAPVVKVAWPAPGDKADIDVRKARSDLIDALFGTRTAFEGYTSAMTAAATSMDSLRESIDNAKRVLANVEPVFNPWRMTL